MKLKLKVVFNLFLFKIISKMCVKGTFIYVCVEIIICAIYKGVLM